MDKYIRPEHIEKAIQEVIVFLPRVPIAILFLLVGWIVIRFIVKGFSYALSRRNVDAALKNFLLTIASILLKILLLISVASTVGIATTSFITMLGAAGLAIGLALQGSLSNFAGSVILMVFKPYRIGDTIVSQNQEGVVKDISIFNTVLNTYDNQRVIIPNGVIAGGVIINMTAEKTRRVAIKVGISYDDSIDKARSTLLNMIASDQRILRQPIEPQVVLQNFGASSLDIELRVWVQTTDYWAVHFDLMEKVKTQFDKDKISIPFPQTDIHFYNKNPQA